MNKNKEYVISDDTSMVKGIIERGKIINELKENNNYDQKIVDFYHDGFFEIKGEKIRVDSVSLNVVKTENEEKNISEIEKDIEDLKNYSDIAPNTEETSLVVVKETPLIIAQNMFKKSIKVSLKSFLISLSLSFLNLFI